MRKTLPSVIFWVSLLLVMGVLSPGCGGSASNGGAQPSVAVHLVAPGVASKGIPITVGLTQGSSTADPLHFIFGDGEEETTSSRFASHVFKEAGTYKVSVTYQIGGTRGEASQVIKVLDTPGPEAGFRLPSPGSYPTFGDLPFPCEPYRGQDGTIHVNGIPAQGGTMKNAIQEGLLTVDGFGTNAAAYFWFSGDIDPQVLPEDPSAFARPGSPLFVINIDPSSSSYKKRTPLAASWDSNEKRLSVMPYPGFPLEEHSSYGLVLTSFITGPTGTVVASPDFLALRDQPSSLSSVPEHVQALYLQLWNALDGQVDIPTLGGIPCATVFTTQTITRSLVSIREALEAGGSGMPEPQPSFEEQYIYGEGFPNSLDSLIGEQPLSGPGYDPPSHDQIGVIVTRALYSSPDYLSPDRDFFDPQGGQFVVQGGSPVIQGVKRIPFTLVLPRSAPPPEGYPVVIVQHGLGLARWYEPIIQANELARNGFAVISIDAVMHGDRYDVSNINPLALLLLNKLLPSLGMEFPIAPVDRIHNYTGSAGPDGWADPNHDGAQLAFVKGFFNLAGVRDNVLQTVVDQMQLARMIRNGPLTISGLGSIRFQGDKILYLGNSLGAWIGSILVSVEPRLEAAVLNCGGGGVVINLLVNSPAFGGEFGSVLKTLFGFTDSDLSSEFSPILNLVQVVVEALDPLNWAGHATASPFEFSFGRALPKNVLLNEVMWDNSMPNKTTEALARAFGASLLQPSYREVPFLAPGDAHIVGNIAGGQATAALAQYAPGEHGFNIGWRQGHIYFQLGFPFEEPPRFRPVVDAEGKSTQYPIRNPVVPGVAQLIDFLLTALENGAGHVEMKYGYAPLHDYDDDGYLDDTEIHAGADPSNPFSHP